MEVNASRQVVRVYYLTFIIFLVLPAWITWQAWFIARDPFSMLANSAILLFCFFVSRWDLPGCGWRWLSMALFLPAVALRVGWWPALLTITALAFTWAILRSEPKNQAFLNLRFPLCNGLYYVAQGGANRLLNYHHPSHSQCYAIDLTRLNALGARASGVLPRRLEAYRIYGDVVYSPCAGIVTHVVGDLPDQTPADMDAQNVAGNNVTIKCDGTDIFVGLAHLRQGTLRVHEGDRVMVGQPIGCVGNSGRSSEPHLHIHAKRGGDPRSILDGAGVPLHFDGRWLVRNSLVLVKVASARRMAVATS